MRSASRSILWAVGASVGIVAACGGSAPTHPRAATPVPVATQGRPSEIVVTKAEYGKDWPFKGVTEGTLRCNFVSEVVIELDGTVFGLNGAARGSEKYKELGEKILIDYPNRVGTQPLIDRGLELCD